MLKSLKNYYAMSRVEKIIKIYLLHTDNEQDELCKQTFFSLYNNIITDAKYESIRSESELAV